MIAQRDRRTADAARDALYNISAGATSAELHAFDLTLAAHGAAEGVSRTRIHRLRQDLSPAR